MTKDNALLILTLILRAFGALLILIASISYALFLMTRFGRQLSIDHRYYIVTVHLAPGFVWITSIIFMAGLISLIASGRIAGIVARHYSEK